MLNPTESSKIQGLFKALECFSSTFQGKFNFQGLFKKALYIQVLYKPVQTLCIQASKGLGSLLVKQVHLSLSYSHISLVPKISNNWPICIHKEMRKMSFFLTVVKSVLIRAIKTIKLFAFSIFCFRVHS